MAKDPAGVRTITPLDIRLGLWRPEGELERRIRERVVPTLARVAVQLLQEQAAQEAEAGKAGAGD